MFIDTHAHLDRTLNHLENQNTDYLFDDLLSATIHINLNCEDFYKNYSYFSQNKKIFFATGFYPDHAADPNFQIQKEIQNLRSILLKFPHLAIGETGIDLKDDSYGSLFRQGELFEAHLTLAEELNLPIIIHSRFSFDEVWNLVKQSSAKIIMHCFSYTTKEAEQILSRGDIISFSGLLTYKKSLDLHEVAQMIPLDQVFFETDSPYLSPVPFRGKINFPIYVKHTYEFFATLRNLNLEELCLQIQKNVQKTFPKITLQ